MVEALHKRVKKYANHFEEVSGISACILNLVDQCFYDGPPPFCRDSCPCREKSCDCFQVHQRNCREAERWDGRYTYYCPLNLLFVATYCTSNTGIPIGIVAGPFLLDSFDRDAFPGLDAQALDILQQVPVMSTSKSYHFGETLAALLTCCGMRDRGFSPTENQWDTINKMFHLATSQEMDSVQTGYSIEMERRLSYLISEGDSDGAAQQISQLLSYLVLSATGNIQIIRSRCMELLVIISRSAIDAGADIETIFSLNDKYFEEFQKYTTPQELCMLVSSAASCYALMCKNAKTTKYSYAISKAINYIRQNYMGKITLDGTAKAVYLSRSYFSKLFAEEVGTTFSNYVIQTRIEKSKQLLLNTNVKLADVACLVGFVDQSYYTKCFRKLVGVSPGKYRRCQGKLDGGEKNYASV